MSMQGAKDLLSRIGHDPELTAALTAALLAEPERGAAVVEVGARAGMAFTYAEFAEQVRGFAERDCAELTEAALETVNGGIGGLRPQIELNRLVQGGALPADLARRLDHSPAVV